jgi:uncharacterized protein YciI
MFLLLLTNKKPAEEAAKFLEAHRTFLDKYYALNKLICSGPKNPRDGGVILCTASTREEVMDIFKEDPFYTEQISEYQIIEFIPNKCDPRFECFLK